MYFPIITITIALLNVDVVSSSRVRNGNQQRRGLVTDPDVLSDITKLIKKQFGGSCDKFYRTFDTTKDGYLSESEVGHLSARLSVFLLVDNAGNPDYEPITAAKLYEQCRDRGCDKECFCPTPKPPSNPIPAPVPAPVYIPVAEPVPASVPAPVTDPVAEPFYIPVAEPVPDPVVEPVYIPVAVPVESPVDPIPVPVASPIEAPTVLTPVAAPEPVDNNTPVSVPSNGDNPVGGGVVGDPHFVTWYGSHFSYHGACDLVFIHNPNFGMGRGLDLHIRTTHMMDRTYSFVSNASLRIGNDALEVVASGKHLINGVLDAQLPATIGGYPVSKRVEENCRGSDDRRRCWFNLMFDINLGNQDHVLIKVASGMVHVNVQGTAKSFEGSVGVMGTYPANHRGKIGRDGTTFIPDVVAYVTEWQVRDVEPKLFNESRFPQHPQMCVPPDHSPNRERRLFEDVESRRAAEEACANVKGPEWEFCVFDVLATGDYGMAATIYGHN